MFAAETFISMSDVQPDDGVTLDTDAGIVSCFKDVQLLKASFSIAVVLSGRTMFVRSVQSANIP